MRHISIKRKKSVKENWSKLTLDNEGTRLLKRNCVLSAMEIFRNVTGEE